nr:immunoglobulin light chain junction region [Macaca mulatta]
CYQYFSGFTF